MTDTAWAEAWALMMTAYAPPRPTRDLVLVMGLTYKRLLADVSDSALGHAVGKACCECKWFPSVAEIRERLPGLLTEDDHGEAAWARVLRSVGPDGPSSYHPERGSMPTGADLDTATMSAIGGRQGLRRIWDAEGNPDAVGFMKRDFLAAYKNCRHQYVAGFLPTGDGVALLEAPGAATKRLLAPNEAAASPVQTAAVDLGVMPLKCSERPKQDKAFEDRRTFGEKQAAALKLVADLEAREKG